MSRPTSIGPLRRLALLPEKIRARGMGWLGRRIKEITISLLHNGALRAEIGKARIAVLHRVVLRLGEFLRNNPTDLHVFYDLDLYPISYDVAYFLIWADLERQRRGLHGLHMIFVPIRNDDLRQFPEGYSQVIDHHSRQWRFRNIAQPIATLLPSSKGLTVCASRPQGDAILLTTRHHFPEQSLLILDKPGLAAMYQDIVAHLRLGEEYRGLQASAQGLRYVKQWVDCYAAGKKLVVITLRQYQVDSQRNNDMDAWTEFARGLDRDVYAPIFVPDTDHAYDGTRPRLDEFLVFDAAAWNLEIRIALYESAYLNLTVNTGPATLCVLNSRCRYLMFKITVPDVYLASERVLMDYGFSPGENPPFTTPYQKWVWERDELPIIRREFEAMCRTIESASLPQREWQAAASQ